MASGQLTPPARRPVCVRALFGVCPVVVRGPRCYPCGETPTQVRDGIHQDKVDEMVLALLSLTMFEEDQYGARAWKGHDWVAMDRLQAKGYISDPKSKARSVVVTVQGVQPIPRAVRETLREERTVSDASGRLAVRVAEPFRSGKRVRARITARQAPFRQERGTPGGCASLRGVDRPRPRP